MPKKKRPVNIVNPNASDKQTTLGDLLNPEIQAKLKAKAAELKAGLKAEEDKRNEEKRKQKEAALMEELTKNENDMEYLLNNSKMDWRKHK